MEKKFQIFVSSTYTDLVEERQDTLKSILDLGHIPSGMEGFFAADEEQLSYIKKIIDECDYYVLIIGGRYGSVDEQGISFTEREYDYAVERGINVLAFIHSDPCSIPVMKSESDPERINRLELFRKRVSQGRLVSQWESREKLRTNILVSLSKAIRHNPGIGWVRGDTAATESVLAQLNQIRNENDALRRENSRLTQQLTPQVENMASLDELYEITFEYAVYYMKQKLSGKIFLSWKEIFRSVGLSLSSPKLPSTISTSLKHYICRLRPELRDVSIERVDLETIKLQLSAYGYIRVDSGKTASGTMAEFIELTDLGRRVLTEIGVVRSSLPPE